MTYVMFGYYHALIIMECIIPFSNRTEAETIKCM